MKILDYFRSSVVWGVLFIGGGVALLLQNLLGWPLGSLFWAVVLAAAGLGFLAIRRENPALWWPYIPAFVLFGLALSSLADGILPAALGFLSGGLFFGMFAVGFILVYLSSSQHWWALIPAGVMLTLALVSAVDDSNLAIDSGAILFLGLAVTFFAVALLPGKDDRRWAYIPGGILAVIGVLVLGVSGEVFNYVVGAGLLLGGIVLVVRALRPAN